MPSRSRKSPVNSQTKRCSRCRAEKPVDAFYWRIRATGVRQPRCIACTKEVRGARPKRYLLSDVPRECRNCKVVKPAADFNFKNQKEQRRQSWCQTCQRDQLATRARRNTLRRHGLTEETHLLLLAGHGNACAICRKADGGPGERLYVDHNHETGRVRGLLCMNCNSALGHFLDNPEHAAPRHT